MSILNVLIFVWGCVFVSLVYCYFSVTDNKIQKAWYLIKDNFKIINLSKENNWNCYTNLLKIQYVYNNKQYMCVFNDGTLLEFKDYIENLQPLIISSPNVLSALLVNKDKNVELDVTDTFKLLEGPSGDFLDNTKFSFKFENVKYLFPEMFTDDNAKEWTLVYMDNNCSENHICL